MSILRVQIVDYAGPIGYNDAAVGKREQFVTVSVNPPNVPAGGRLEVPHS